jgi:hypothetical protein
MKNIIVSLLAILLTFSQAFPQEHRFDPPWNEPLQSKVMFTVPGVDNVPDLFGDINDPQLVVFFAGNQFMCIDHPDVRSIHRYGISEVYYQQMIKHPVEMITIPDAVNIQSSYVAGLLNNAPHKQAARDFMDFLNSPAAKAIYKKYGFTTN